MGFGAMNFIFTAVIGVAKMKVLKHVIYKFGRLESSGTKEKDG